MAVLKIGFYSFSFKGSEPAQGDDSKQMTNQHQQTRLEAALKNQYKLLVGEMEKPSKQGDLLRMDQMFQRQQQIIKELEICTGLEVPVKTIQEILEENKRIQEAEWNEARGNLRNEYKKKITTRNNRRSS
ncbi:MAG: hypothetical protein ACJ73C_07985 [Nitrososphaeraceae archaeon]